MRSLFSVSRCSLCFVLILVVSSLYSDLPVYSQQEEPQISDVMQAYYALEAAF